MRLDARRASAAASARASGYFANSAGRDDVHARVGGLRGEDRRDQQLERRCGSGARYRRRDAALESASRISRVAAAGRGSATARLSAPGRRCAGSDVARAAPGAPRSGPAAPEMARPRARAPARGPPCRCPASAALSVRISSSESGCTSQNVSVQSNGVCAIAQKFAYVRSDRPPSSGTIVKLICFRSAMTGV